ncbi:MAG: sugar phosphate nucleotidyltransferase [Verrucomicrobiota bacterium]
MEAGVKKAVILAAGRGTRMRELTDELPKPMIPVRGRPILEHIVSGLGANGVEEILIVVGYREDVVRGHFGDGSAFGVGVSYVTQDVQDGTGRVVLLAKDFAGADPFILSYGDILVPEESYASLTRLGDAAAILTVKRTDDVSKGGAVFLDDEFRVTGLIEKPGPDQPQSPWYNTGIYTFTQPIFEYCAALKKSPRGEYELTDAIVAMVEDGLILRGDELPGDWADVRDPEVLEELNRDG